MHLNVYWTKSKARAIRDTGYGTRKRPSAIVTAVGLMRSG